MEPWDSKNTASSANVAQRLMRSAEPVQEDEASCGALDTDGDDSSLVLYKDPSGVSAQRSRGSVMSGAHDQADTFFTALKKQASWQEDDAASELSTPAAGKAAGVSCAASGYNPMQSLSHSAFFSAADDDGSDGGSLREGDCNSELIGAEASTESSYAMLAAEATPAAGASTGVAAGCSGVQLTSSVLDVINGVYGSQPSPSSSRQWPQLTLHDRPLMASSSPPQPFDKGSTPAGDDAAADDAVVGGFDSSVNSTAETQTRKEATEQLQLLLAPCKDAQAASEAAASPQDMDKQDEASDNSSSSDGRALLAATDTMLSEHSRVQVELSGYLQQLGSRAGEDGEPLVHLEEEYAVLVERLLREGRAQGYRALQGWEGPHRFEDLPVAQLHTKHADPQVAAGLAAIAKLDGELREASLKALVTARALNPEQWADTEKRRLERRAAELDAALAKERQRRAHAAKLRGALSKLDEDYSSASLLCLATGGPSYYRLKPHEEALLTEVLSRDDAVLEADNPFDPMLLSLDDDLDADQRGTAAGLTAGNQERSAHELFAVDEKSSSCSTDQGHAVLAGPAPTAAAGQAEDVSRGSSAAHAASPDEGVSRASSCATLFSLLRPSSSSSGAGGRRRSLADIDARLDAMQAERERAQQSRISSAGMSRSSSISTKSSTRAQPGHAQHNASPAEAKAIASSSIAAASTCGSTRSGHPPRLTSSSSSRSAGPSGSVVRRASANSSTSSRRCSAASGGTSVPSSSTVHNIDYIREQREAKELQQREKELDAQLRALQTSELSCKLAPHQLQALLQCAY